MNGYSVESADYNQVPDKNEIVVTVKFETVDAAQNFFSEMDGGEILGAKIQLKHVNDK
jgi:hypothetical protein